MGYRLLASSRQGPRKTVQALSQKKKKEIHLKQIKFRPNIGANDYEVKMKNILKALAKRIDVKVLVELRGRELAHPEMGRALLTKITEEVSSAGKPQTPAFRGRSMSVLIKPK